MRTSLISDIYSKWKIKTIKKEIEKIIEYRKAKLLSIELAKDRLSKYVLEDLDFPISIIEDDMEFILSTLHFLDDIQNSNEQILKDVLFYLIKKIREAFSDIITFLDDILKELREALNQKTMIAQLRWAIISILIGIVVNIFLEIKDEIINLVSKFIL